MAAIGNRDFLYRSQIEDRDVWVPSINDFWKELDAFSAQLRAPATAPVLFDRATSATDWRNRQFKQILNAVAEARLQKDPEKFQEVFSGIAYIYRRFVEKSAKDPLAPASNSLVKFLKEIQAGSVVSKEKLRVPGPEPQLELVQQGDPLQHFKMALVSPEYSDDVKFGIVAQGFDFAYQVMAGQAKKLQKLVRRVVDLEATAVEEGKARKDLDKKLQASEAESKKQNEEMAGLKKKLDESEKAREEQKEKIIQQEQRSLVQEQQFQEQQQRTRNLAQQAAIRREHDKKLAWKVVSSAWDEMTKWEILSGVTLGMGLPRFFAKERSWALLYAQWRYFDELEAIPDLAERSRRINIYANRALRKEGHFSRIRGKNVFPNGRWYNGEFHDDNTLITGILRGPENYWYKGPFFGGKPHGDDGEEKTLEGTYTGQFYHGLWDGYGILEMTDGDEYRGFFSKGLKEGLGRLDFANGDKYVGEFHQDKRHGLGHYFFASRGDYEGEFRDDMMHGHGTLRFANGDMFVGMFENDEIHGHGIMRWADGHVREDDF